MQSFYLKAVRMWHEGRNNCGRNAKECLVLYYLFSFVISLHPSQKSQKEQKPDNCEITILSALNALFILNGNKAIVNCWHQNE